MSQAHGQVVYIAYGHDAFRSQAAYSALTLLHRLLRDGPHDARVVIYTDDRAGLPRHERIETRIVRAAEIEAYRGPRGFVHRVKLAVLEDARRRHDGPIIYVDGDTKWERGPAEAFAALERPDPPCFMHECEGTLAADNHPDYLRVLDEGVPFQRRFGIRPPWVMWNAGVIGVPPVDPGFFTDALAATDELLAVVRHDRWAEQLAVSLLASARFPVRPFADHVVHAWRDSYALTTVLARLQPRLVGDAERDAATCADFPLGEELARYRRSFGGWLHRRCRQLSRLTT